MINGIPKIVKELAEIKSNERPRYKVLFSGTPVLDAKGKETDRYTGGDALYDNLEQGDIVEAQVITKRIPNYKVREGITTNQTTFLVLRGQTVDGELRRTLSGLARSNRFEDDSYNEYFGRPGFKMPEDFVATTTAPAATMPAPVEVENLADELEHVAANDVLSGDITS